MQAELKCLPHAVLLIWLALLPPASAGPLMPLRDLAQVAAGASISCALTTAGAVKCWGSGTLGDGYTSQSALPVDVVGLGTGVVEIAVGSAHVCALTTVGAVKCWGANGHGQLGDNSTTTRTTPVDVVGLGGNVLTIGAGGSHTCAVTTAGAVKCWGRNTFGQLGDGTTTNRLVPTLVSGLGSGFKAVSGGAAHSCALSTAGRATCWGRNASGQLGIGGNDPTDVLVPTDVYGLGSGVAAIRAGYEHTCARTDTGAAKCWGADWWGQLGIGGFDRSNWFQPMDVVGAGNGVTAVAVGTVHSCLVTSAGAVKCWGKNDDGQIGDGSNTDRYVPTAVAGLSSGGVALGTGDNHTCVLTSAGGAKCWGQNIYGELGYGETRDDPHPLPRDVSGLSGSAITIRSGDSHTCAVTAAGALECWGNNQYGRLGIGTTDWRNAPTVVTGMGMGTLAADTGSSHTCAIRNGGALQCWGGNSSAQVGDDSIIDRYTPVGVFGLASGVLGVAAGGGHSCALTAGGGVKCWGASSMGQSGTGIIAGYLTTPQDVLGLASGASTVDVGSNHSCALVGGIAKCWGWNHVGQLGDGSIVNRAVPTDVAGLGTGVRAINLGPVNTCAITSGGGAKCWGYNGTGGLGDGTITDRQLPVDVNGLGSGVTAIAAGPHSCAVTTAGALKCWGRNGFGQLGDGSTVDRLAPVDVVGLGGGVSAVSVGQEFTCALLAGGSVKCWGRSINGSLGIGGRDDRLPGDVLTINAGYLFGSGFEEGE